MLANQRLINKKKTRNHKPKLANHGVYGQRDKLQKKEKEKDKEAERIYYDMLKVVINDSFTKRKTKKANTGALISKDENFDVMGSSLKGEHGVNQSTVNYYKDLGIG